MSRLNNRGFGMSTMLIFIGIFIIILVAIMVLAYNNGIEQGSNDPALKRDGELFVSPDVSKEEEE